ncbi:cardiomyopathy-associated protein 5 isoform X2 [Brachyistius frenatus]|uniref:cardiomyopathy-associated protein 5 isoform X2 n=1 Tax=Brachyistius frenatus TaxID=100188 RepID=UPI0037E8CB9C
MEDGESLDSEMTELQEFRCEASDAISQDDEDEIEELQNSLREAVQDQSVKPKLQCLMVDPSFSMVTVQSEDSGIVWETASSRCSTPWASETSSISEAYSMEGSGAAGKITIVFDEEKVVRRRTRSGGRSSRLGDRLSRPGSSRSASALGVERLEMAEVSLPNVKQEKTKTEPDLEEIKNKDQQLFSLISEGYEILNIRVPSKLPTVDEEESTELQDNLSYLDQTPKIRSRNHHDWPQQQNQVQPDEEEVPDHQESSKQDSSQPSADTECTHTHTQKESPGDIDYFEKFTLLDVVVPAEQARELQEEADQPAMKPQSEVQKPAKEVATDSPSAAEDSFVFVTDVEIVGEHLDEVFYGEGAPADALQHREDEEGAGMRTRRESQRSKEGNGSVLFRSEETTLTPIFISPGPPKIIDLILLEEPTAMSFMYSDLYEDAVGERRKSDEECSEAESVASEKTYKRRLSDSEEADGYLEKFTLKDEIPTVDVKLESVEDEGEGRMMWPQSKFEMTGCLVKVVKEEDREKTKTEEPKTQEVSVGDQSEDLHSAVFEEKREIVTEREREEIQSMVAQEQPIGEASEDSVQESKPMEEQMEVQQVMPEIKTDQTEPPEHSTGKSLPETQKLDSKIKETEESKDHQIEEEKICGQSNHCCEPPHQTQQLPEEKAEGLVVTTDQKAVTAPVSSEVSSVVTQSEIQSKSTEKSLSEEAATDTKMVAADEKLVTEAEAEASVDLKEPETDGQEILCSTEPSAEMKTSAAALPCEGTKAVEVVPEDVAPVEVITDCDPEVHTVVKVTEKEVNDKEIQTQVQIDLQDAASIETTDVQTAAPEGEKECPTEETTAENRLSKSMVEGPADEHELEIKAEISNKVIKPVMLEEVKADSDKKHDEILETEQQQQKMTIKDSDKTKLITEITSKMPTEETGTLVQDVVSVGDDLILLVPKGQTVEMDIEISQWSERTSEDTVALPEPDSTCELQAPVEETKVEPQMAVEPEVFVQEEEPPRDDLNRELTPPVEEAETEEQKLERDAEEDKVIFSPLKSFTPQEDLSGLSREDVQSEDADVEEKVKKGEEPETDVIKEDVIPYVELHMEDTGQKVERGEAVTEALEVSVDELEYEVISEQDVKKMAEPEAQRDKEEPEPGSDLKQEEKMEVDDDKADPAQEEEELIEADYEIIDAEEESQARLAAELQGMDWFCLTCGCLLSEEDRMSGEHHGHEVKTVDKGYEEIKETLSDWISELQARSENIEDLVSELELAYNSVEDQCVESEAAMQAQNEEMMAVVMEQYNNMSVSMEEEKKAKLEQLYDQIVSFQESIDSTKATLETTAREAETDARSPEDIHERLKAALDSASSLELGPKGLLVFEDYAKANTSSSNLAQRKRIPVPQRPTLQPQEPGSATSTSVTVYWKVNPGDIIDCFQVYCMEDPQGAVSEEYRVTVKESYCVLEELEPDKMYKVWVMAVNYTGCSLPSERLIFRTDPSRV